MRKFINGRSVAHVDKETGEVICETDGCTYVKDNHKTPMELELEEYKKNPVENFNADKQFVKMYKKMAYVLAMKLTAPEYRLAFALSNFVAYESCILINGEGRNTHFMTLDEIADVMNFEYSNTAKLVKNLIKKGVMAQIITGEYYTRQEVKCYVMNPYIYINGKNPERDTVRAFFKNSGWQEIMESEGVFIHPKDKEGLATD